ncbi:MAG: hypothetical protein ACJAX4_004545 [Clostridium sp.]|jgi:hypothetical protein
MYDSSITAEIAYQYYPILRFKGYNKNENWKFYTEKQ